MQPLGIDLKATREKKNITLREVAEATRINLTHLKNIEEGRYADLPGGIYNRAFLRAYCDYVGLDSREYLSRYETELAPPGERVTKHKPKTVAEKGTDLSIHPLVVWGAMLIVSAVGLYFSRHWISAVFSPYFSRSPVSKISPQDLPGPKPLETKSSTAAPAPAPANASSGAPGKTEAPEIVTQQSVVPDQPKETRKPGILPPQAPGTIRLEFQVIQKCWVSVNSDGNRVLNRLLEPGDDQFFDATQRFYLIFGNAGGVRLKINGKAAKPLGKPGDVVKLLINEQNLSDLLEKASG